MTEIFDKFQAFLIKETDYKISNYDIDNEEVLYLKKYLKYKEKYMSLKYKSL